MLNLKWSKNCVLSEISRTAAIVANLPNPAREATETTRVTFQIDSTKLHTQVVTLSITKNIKFLENINQGFERSISWNIGI